MLNKRNIYIELKIVNPLKLLRTAGSRRFKLWLHWAVASQILVYFHNNYSSCYSHYKKKRCMSRKKGVHTFLPNPHLRNKLHEA
jgi:hypothetical protein